MLRSLLAMAYGAALATAALVTTLATPVWCAGPEWVLLDENPDSRFYYDKSAALKPHEGIVRIKTRVVYTEEGKADALKILNASNKLSGLFESRYQHDLDCKKQESRLLEVSHLDEGGVTLKSTDLATSTEWEEIPPDARMGLVLEKVCPPAPAQK
jgi:hypothetical protein